MDDYVDILEVQHSDGSGETVYTGSEQSGELTVEDLHLLRLENLEQVQEIINLYAEVEVPRDHIELFKQYLLQRTDTWFVEVADVGLIYLINIIPDFSAQLQVIFWDRRFGKERRELVRAVVATAFEEFNLQRIAAAAPESNTTLAYTALPKIGFVKEGLLRKAWRDRGVDYDLHVFSLLAAEVREWPAVPHLMISSAPVS